MKKIVITTCILLGISVFQTQSDELNKVEDIVESTVREAISILEDEELPRQEKKEKASESIAPFFNFKLMGMLTLGKKHWRSLTPEQRKNYTELYVEHLKESFLDKAALFSDSEIAFKEAHWQDKSSKKIHAKMTVFLNEKQNTVIYKFHQSDGKWQVYDLKIADVSLIKSYAKQYRATLERNEPKALFEEIRESIQKLQKNDMRSPAEQELSAEPAAEDKDEQPKD